MPSFIDEINAERAKQGKPLVPIAGTNPIADENALTSTLNLITGAQALGIGAADMANNTVFGGVGQVLGTLGDLIERVSPFSGEGISENDRKIFNKWGYTDEEIDAKYPREDSWITNAAKTTLQQGLENQDYLRQLELETLGANPSFGVRAARGTGTSLGFAGLGAVAAALGGGPFAVAAAMGIPEAASESGGTMLDAYRQGRYDDGGVAAANKGFLANALVNVGLDFFLNPINGKAFVGGIKDPLLRWGAKGVASIANEGLQEPTQDIISEAAINSLNNGTGFMSELGEGVKQWPKKAWETFPEVAGSTALTQLLMGLLPGNIPGGIAHEYSYNRQLEQGQQVAPQVKENVNSLVNDPLIGTLKAGLNEAGKKEVNNLQADIEAVIKNLNTVGYNNYQELDQNLTHLENIKQTIQNYGKSVSEIKMNAIQEQQRRAYSQAQAQAQAMQAEQAEQQRIATENEAQREYLRQWRETNPPQTKAPLLALPEREKPVPPVQSPRVKKLNDLGTRLSELSGKTLTPEEQQEFNELVTQYEELYDKEYGYGKLLDLANQQNTAGSPQNEINPQLKALDKQLYGDNADIKPQQVNAPTNISPTTPLKATKQIEQNSKKEAKQQPVQQQEQKPAQIEETPDIVKGAQNNAGHAKTSAGTQVDFRYRVIEAGDLITSHKDNFSLNPDYDQKLQGRKRSSVASQLQIARIANAPDPERLAQNILASDGAPVIDKNKMVISGNGRSMGLRQAYKQGTANGYREWITQHAHNFGVDPDYISKMKSPVLVREITSDVKDMAKFAAEANESSISSMASSEKAMSNADLISEEDLLDFDFDKDFASKANRKFIVKIISKMPASEQASLLQSNGKPSSLGIERVRQALIAKAYNNENILAELTDTDDTDIPTVAKGLEVAAPQMAKFEYSNIRPELSLAEDINQAISILKDIKEKNESVEERTGTKDMFSSNETSEVITDEAMKLLKFFGTKKQNGRSRTAKQISQGLINYAKEAMKEVQEGQKTLTNDFLQTKGQILDKILNEIYKSEELGVETLEIKGGEDSTRQLSVKEVPEKAEPANAKNTTFNATTERLRQDIEKQLVNAGVPQEEAKINSELFIKWEENFAKINGISLEQSLAAENLKVEFHEEIIDKDKAGHMIGKPRAQITIRNGEAILKITKMSDQSSILHEFGHLFLQRIYNLARNNNLKEGTLKQNWDALLEAYNVTEHQLAENPALFKEVHERFATDLERYMREGKSPNKGLKHVFETFKKWLRGIYASIRDIEYIGTDRRRHSPRLSKEARQFFNYMLGDNVQQEIERQNDEKRMVLTDRERREQTLADTQDTDEWGITFDQASKKTKGKNKEPSLHQRILNYLKDYFKGEKITSKERARREALINTIKSPMKSYQTTEQNKSEQPQEIKVPPKEKMSPTTTNGLPDISFTNGEQRYQEAKRGVQKLGIIKQGKRIVKNLAEGFKGSYAELQGNDDNGNSLWKIKTRFDKLAREQSKMANDAMGNMIDNIKDLNDWQFDLFKRVRILNDLKWRIDDFEKSGKGTPGLPYGWTKEDFEKSYEKIEKIVKDPKNKAITDAVMKAVEADEKAMRKIALDFVDAANKLGIKLNKRFPNPHYFHHVVLEYAEAAAEAQSQGRRVRSRRIANEQDFVNAKLKAVFGRDYLKKYKGVAGDISANYLQAMGEVRTQMVIDTATMRALADVKNQYKDINLQFRENYEKAIKREQAKQEAGTFNQSSGNEEEIDINKILPDGYELFSPSMSGLIKGANSLTENAFTQAFNEVSEQSGVPFNEILNVAGLNDEETFDQMFVIPTQVKKVLEKMASRSNKRESILGHWARKLTSMWKFDVLYNPLRNFKYNIRNFTGDLDAIISGLGKDWIPYFSKASKDLWAHLHGEKASPELQDFLDRAGGRMLFQTMMFDNAELARQDKVMSRKVDPNAPLYKKVWGKTANIAKFLMNKEVELTEYRESLLRYTAYLTFQADMDKNNGVPTRWAASNKDEILALNDFRDRAYEMSNDLLGAYDKISNTGKELRSMLMPFWSWQEVNMKRYFRLLKNGFSGNNAREGGLTQRLLMAKAAKIPYYSVAAASTLAKISVLQAMMTAWNWCVTPDADDDLPKDVKSKAHITLGNWGGKIYYFDRLGAMADALDWFALDAWPLEFKELADGKQSLGQFATKVVQAPVNKFVAQLNPFLKMPIELATGRSFYPDVFKSKTITDSGEHIARSLALEWPYKEFRKLFTGKPFSNAEEAMKVFLYSIDPEEAAYFNTLDNVRKFKERVLDKHFDGFASTKRGTVLRNLKTAIRFDDKEAIRRYLREYNELDGTPQGLKQSMKAMNPLFGMNEKEKKGFMKWITPEDREELRRAERYWRKLTRRFL